MVGAIPTPLDELEECESVPPVRGGTRNGKRAGKQGEELEPHPAQSLAGRRGLTKVNLWLIRRYRSNERKWLRRSPKMGKSKGATSLHKVIAIHPHSTHGGKQEPKTAQNERTERDNLKVALSGGRYAEQRANRMPLQRRIA